MSTTATTQAMTPERMEAVATRWHADVFERDQYDLVDELCTTDFVWHNDALQPELRTLDGAKNLARAMREGFSDYRLSHREDIATVMSGDRVVTFWRFVGTHDGEFLGFPPSGDTVEITGIDAFVMRDGRIAALYQEFDMLGWLQQIGAIPTG
jgi:steroid delta-isomerase-like uncharacterized protein